MRKGKIILVAAIGKNNEIGKDNKLLFNNKKDKEWFLDITKDRIVIMGRNTFESMNSKPLYNRTNIVLTKDYKDLNIKNNYSSLKFFDKKHLDNYIKYITGVENRDVYIIGGESLYKEYINICDELFITKVFKEWNADTYFPVIDDGIFDISYSSDLIYDDNYDCYFMFIKFKRS